MYSLLTFVRCFKAGDWNAVVTMGAAYLLGVAVSFLVAASDFATSLKVDELNAASLVIAGVLLGSSTTVLDKFIKSRDNSQSAETPQLMPSKTGE